MIYYLQMQDLDHSFHSPKYELTISHGNPIHGPGSFLKSSSFALLFPVLPMGPGPGPPIPLLPSYSPLGVLGQLVFC